MHLVASRIVGGALRNGKALSLQLLSTLALYQKLSQLILLNSLLYPTLVLLLSLPQLKLNSAIGILVARPTHFLISSLALNRWG